MNGDQKIILAGSALLVIGVSKASLDKKPIDKPIIAGLSIMLLLATIAFFGPDAADFAGTLALVALVGALLADGQQLLNALQQIQGPAPAKGK